MTSIKKEIMKQTEKQLLELVGIANHTKPGQVTHKIEEIKEKLSLSLTRIEEAAREEERAKAIIDARIAVYDIYNEHYAHFTREYNEVDEFRDKIYKAINKLSPSEEKEVGYMGKVTNAGNIASSEKDSVCNCDGTVHRKSSHSPKKEKRGR